MRGLDIIDISERWWNEDNQWDTVIPGYKLYRNDRTDQIGEGVALYVREGIESQRIKVLQETKFTVESLSIEIPRKKGKGKVMAVARMNKWIMKCSKKSGKLTKVTAQY